MRKCDFEHRAWPRDSQICERKLWSYLIGFVAPKYAITLARRRPHIMPTQNTAQYCNGQPSCMCMFVCASISNTDHPGTHAPPRKVMTWLKYNNHTKALTKVAQKQKQHREGAEQAPKPQRATITAELPQQQYSRHTNAHRNPFQILIPTIPPRFPYSQQWQLRVVRTGGSAQTARM